MSKKFFGLGKGLGSLIPESAAEGVNTKRENIFYVEVSKIQPNPDQPRRDFDIKALDELSRSIRKFGVLQPLLVAKIEEDLPRGRAVRYQLIAGERRWRAAQLAGLPQVPVIIRDDLNPTSTDENKNSTRLEVALIENLQRENLNPLEMAEAYVRLATEFGLRHEEIAEKVGKSREAVNNTMRLLNLPQYIKDALRAGKITGTMGRALLSFKDVAKQKEMFELALAGGFNTREMENTASSAKGTYRRKVVLNAKFDDLMHDLQEYLRTPVLIRAAHGTSKFGQIIIRFATVDDLNAVVKKIID